MTRFSYQRDHRCRILEIISPAGFEHFFDEIAAQVASAGSGSAAGTPDEEALDRKYGIEFDHDSVPRLCREHGLTFPG